MEPIFPISTTQTHSHQLRPDSIDHTYTWNLQNPYRHCKQTGRHDHTFVFGSWYILEYTLEKQTPIAPPQRERRSWHS